MGSNTANIPTANGGNSIGLKMLAIQLEMYAGCPMGVQIVPMSFSPCDSCSRRGEDVVNCWVRYGQSCTSEDPHA